MVGNQVNNVFFILDNQNGLRTDITSSVINPFLQ
jgi:hypothetical protein